MTCLAHHLALALAIHMVSYGSVTSELMRFISYFITCKHLPHQGNKTRLAASTNHGDGMHVTVSSAHLEQWLLFKCSADEKQVCG